MVCISARSLGTFSASKESVFNGFSFIFNTINYNHRYIQLVDGNGHLF